MTREQKIEWLRNADVDELLKQYETCSRETDNPFEYSKRTGLSIEEIFENYDLVVEEIKRRMK